MKILVVDDLTSNRKLLRAVLEAEGATVTEAEDGVAALEQIEHARFDVMISDILMPRMDGYRLFREIRRRPESQGLPIIAYTGTYLSKSDEELATRSGANRYLRKPATAEQLLAAIDDVTKGGASAPSAPRSMDEPGVAEQYNAAVVRKLEDKSAELAERNAELERANLELAASRARFESIIVSAMDAIITIDETQRIVLFNGAAEAMFGTTAAAMLGEPIERLLPERFRAAHAGHVGAFGAGGATSRRMGELGAIAGLRADGEEFPIEAAISRTEVAGRQFCTVILRDISERKRAEAQLRAGAEQLRALAARNENLREQTRTALAREIHDVLAQELTRLKIDLVWLAKRAAKPIDEATRSAVAARIAEAVAQTDTAITSVQRIATELRPVILDSLGLPAAVEWQTEDFARRTGLVCRVTALQGESKLRREGATALFRILQESLTNVARHAQATEVDVLFAEEAATATLIVSDNGCGITPEQVADVRSIGLVGMRERAEAFGGSVQISGAPGRGTTVHVQVPIKVAP